MSQIRIGILDDHPIVLEGLKQQLSNNAEISVLIASNEPEDFLKQLENIEIDIALVDIVLPNYSGVQFFKLLLQEFPLINLIAYSSLNNMMLLENLYKIGVKGYINKNDDVEKILHSLEKVHLGKLAFPDYCAHFLKNKDAEIQLISARELEVIQLISKGLPSSEIALKLFISENTVEKHRKQIFLKLNVTNVAGLIYESLKQGYIS